MFRVEWIQTAVDELATLWMSADSAARRAITAAAHTAESRLQTDPYGCSESRSGHTRVTFVYPLGLEFEIDDDKGVVWVLHVWRYRQRGE
jgi:hypothetical protein